MALDPNQRYQSAKELKTGLYTPITPPPVFSPPPPPPPTQVISPRRPLWILWVGLILILAVALGLGIGYMVNRGIASPTTEPPVNTDAPQGGEIPTMVATATVPLFVTDTPEQPQVTIPPTIPPTEIPTLTFTIPPPPTAAPTDTPYIPPSGGYTLAFASNRSGQVMNSLDGSGQS